MNKKSTIIILVANLLMSVAIALLTVFFMGSWGVLIRVVFYVIAGAGVAASLVTFFWKKLSFLKTAFVLLIVAAVVLVAFIVLSEVGHLNDYPTDEEKIKGLVSLIEGTGGWGMFVYVLIQILQVVILPLPAIVCYVPGSIIWGAPMATLLASIGVIIGSVICYFIGRIWGKKAVVWIAGEEVTNKYSAYFGKRGKGIFVMMQILPFFPDDVLCLIAGLTSMNFPFFIVTMCTVRPAIIAVYCFFGGGQIIPYSGWGIYVWVAIFVVCITLAVLSFKYQDKFESWLVKVFSRKKKGAEQSPPALEEVDAELAPDGALVENSEEVAPDGEATERPPSADPPDESPSETNPIDGDK